MSIRASAFTAQQARAARCVLGLSVAALSEQPRISSSSIRRIEGHQNGITLDLVVRLQEFYEGHGFRFFIEADEAVIRWPVRLAGTR